MPRDVVNVILDRVLDTRDITDKALSESERARAALKKLLRLRLTGGVDQETFEQAYFTLAVACAVPGIADALKLSRDSIAAERKAVTALGPRVREVPALRNEDLMARAAERKGLTDGEVPPAGTK